MQKAKLNFLVDVAAFVAFAFLTTTGILVRYVLPPGSGRFSTLWGLDRHGWGTLHFWVAVALMATLALHLVLHWRWVVCMVRGRPKEGSGLRVGLALVGAAALTALAAAPLFAPVANTGESPRRGHAAVSDGAVVESINGAMTLNDVAAQTGVPVAVMLRELGLPAGAPADRRLGRLRREYGFSMQDLRGAVDRHRPEP